MSMLFAHLTHGIGLNDVCDALRLHSGPLSALRGANGRLLPVVLQSDPQERFPKNGQCITERRSPGDCSHPSELQSPDDPGRPSKNTEITGLEAPASVLRATF